MSCSRSSRTLANARRNAVSPSCQADHDNPSIVRAATVNEVGCLAAVDEFGGRALGGLQHVGEISDAQSFARRSFDRQEEQVALRGQTALSHGRVGATEKPGQGKPKLRRLAHSSIFGAVAAI